MRNIIKSLVMIAAVSATLPAFAAEKKQQHAGEGPSPYTECGIGAALFPKTPVGAVISNVIWDLGTTAVTSAVSSPQTCNGKTVAAATFIFQTYATLEEEAVVGQGEHLASALSLMGCSGSDQVVIGGLQSDLGAAMSHGDAKMGQLQKSERFYNLLQNNIAKSGSCNA